MPNNKIVVLCPYCFAKARFEEITVDEILFRCTACQALLVLPFEYETEEDEEEQQETLDF